MFLQSFHNWQVCCKKDTTQFLLTSRKHKEIIKNLLFKIRKDITSVAVFDERENM
jgi:hypothetical protein